MAKETPVHSSMSPVAAQIGVTAGQSCRAEQGPHVGECDALAQYSERTNWLQPIGAGAWLAICFVAALVKGINHSLRAASRISSPQAAFAAMWA